MFAIRQVFRGSPTDVTEGPDRTGTVSRREVFPPAAHPALGGLAAVGARSTAFDQPAFAERQALAIDLNPHDHRSTVRAAERLGFPPNRPTGNPDGLTIDILRLHVFLFGRS